MAVSRSLRSCAREILHDTCLWPASVNLSLSAQPDELMDAQADVSGNPAKQDGGHVTTAVHRNGGRTSVNVTELLV